MEEFNVCPSYNKNGVLNQVIWYNKNIKINNTPIFYKDMFEKGICKIIHIVKENKQFKSIKDIEEEYGFRLDFLKFQSIINCIPTSWKTLLKSETDICINDKKYVSLNGQEVSIDHITPRIVYDHYIVLKRERSKANCDFSEEYGFTEEDWKSIYKGIHESDISNKAKEFSYKICHGIVASNSFLYKIGKKDSPRCGLCNLYRQTTLHLLVECFESKNFWFRISDYIFNKYNNKIDFNPEMILFGARKKHIHKKIINDMIYAGKYYIYCSSIHNRPLSSETFILQFECDMC